MFWATWESLRSYAHGALLCRTAMQAHVCSCIGCFFWNNPPLILRILSTGKDWRNFTTHLKSHLLEWVDLSSASHGGIRGTSRRGTELPNCVAVWEGLWRDGCLETGAADKRWRTSTIVQPISTICLRPLKSQHLTTNRLSRSYAYFRSWITCDTRPMMLTACRPGFCVSLRRCTRRPRQPYQLFGLFFPSSCNVEDRNHTSGG